MNNNTSNKKVKVKKCLNCCNDYKYKMSTSKYCSDKCRDIFNKKNKGHESTCLFCNKRFRSYYFDKYCSHYCVTEHRKKDKLIRKIAGLVNRLKPCECCGTLYFQKTSRNIYCSKNCSQQEYYIKKVCERKEVYERNCLECGGHFNSTDSRMIFCSKDCCNKMNWRLKDLKRRSKIKDNGKMDKGITVKKLIKKHGSKCYLCGDKVLMNVNHLDDLSPTIEHVVPISKGGTHTWDNVKLAHRICNIKKSNKTMYENNTGQLTLSI